MCITTVLAILAQAWGRPGRACTTLTTVAHHPRIMRAACAHDAHDARIMRAS